MTKAEIQTLLDAALNEQAYAVAAFAYRPPTKHRGTTCTALSCSRPALSRKLCNAHYLRWKKGRPVNVPLRTRGVNNYCWKCTTQKVIDKHGGWGMCKAHYMLARRVILKRTAVRALGGRCAVCNLTVPLAAFDFHHLRDKGDAASAMMQNCSTEKLANELTKCILICANCHRCHHCPNDEMGTLPPSE